MRSSRRCWRRGLRLCNLEVLETCPPAVYSPRPRRIRRNTRNAGRPERQRLESDLRPERRQVAALCGTEAGTDPESGFVGCTINHFVSVNKMVQPSFPPSFISQLQEVKIRHCGLPGLLAMPVRFRSAGISASDCWVFQEGCILRALCPTDISWCV